MEYYSYFDHALLPKLIDKCLYIHISCTYSHCISYVLKKTDTVEKDF